MQLKPSFQQEITRAHIRAPAQPVSSRENPRIQWERSRVAVVSDRTNPPTSSHCRYARTDRDTKLLGGKEPCSSPFLAWCVASNLDRSPQLSAKCRTSPDALRVS